MDSVYHEGELYMQELMGVRDKSDSLSSMIKKEMPIAAQEFLKTLNFCVITFSMDYIELFSSVVFNIKPFIEIVKTDEIVINLDKKSFIPDEIIKSNKVNIGFIGLAFQSRKRIRVNGKGKIINNKLHLKIDEVYANCPKYIHDRKLVDEINFQDSFKLYHYSKFNKECKTIIENTDTFFLSSCHNERGVDVSHKGGQKGFLRVTSSNNLEFDDYPGNNMYNSLGNIYTNPNVNIIVVDFKENKILHISGEASTVIQEQNEKKKIKVKITTTNIKLEKNSFSLKYDK